MTTIGVFGIIFDDRGKVLLCHRRDFDLWNLPGGRIEEGEAPWEGVVREVKEETGLDVKPQKISGLYFKPEQQEIVFAFMCQVVGGSVTLTDEADAITYYAPSELPSKMSQKQIERIHDALGTDLPVMKIQRGPSSRPPRLLVMRKERKFFKL